MKILLTVDPEIPVPPALYGGIERVVNQLGQGYQALGHKTVLLAHPKSQSPHFNKKYGWTGKNSRSKQDSLKNALRLRKVVREEKPDLIHSFSRLLYLSAIVDLKVPIIQTYQREISNLTTSWAKKLFGRRLYLTACGKHLTDRLKSPKDWSIVPNCCDTDALEANESIERTHLVFLGRIEPIKGIAEAIEFSQRTSTPLLIAGNVEAEWVDFFHTKIKPHIDGKQIQYLGPVNDEQKQHLLSRAIAFLMLITWEEPFGIVMAEALACGVPIIALNRGSVPEVVEHGKNGIRGDSLDSLIDQYPLIQEIESKFCRKDATERFSIASVSKQYLDILA